MRRRRLRHRLPLTSSSSVTSTSTTRASKSSQVSLGARVGCPSQGLRLTSSGPLNHLLPSRSQHPRSDPQQPALRARPLSPPARSPCLAVPPEPDVPKEPAQPWR